MSGDPVDGVGKKLDEGREAVKNANLRDGSALVKHDNVYYSVHGGEDFIEKHLDSHVLTLNNKDIQQLNANTVIRYDQGEGGDTVYDASDYSRTSGTDGQTNAQAISESVDLYIDRHLSGSDQVRLVFRGNASTDGEGRVDNEAIAQARADSLEAVFSGALQDKLDARVAEGSITAHDKEKILDYYGAVDENGERINTTNIGSVYEYNANLPVDTTHRNAQVFMGHANGDRLVFETRYAYEIDQKTFNELAGSKGEIHLESLSNRSGKDQGAYKIDKEKNTLTRTAQTDVNIKHSPDGKQILFRFDANNDLAAKKVNFAITADSPDDVSVLTNEEKSTAFIMVDGQYVGRIKLEGGASLSALQIGADTPENGFVKTQNIFTLEENMAMHADAKEMLGIEKYQSMEMLARVQDLGLDNDGLTNKDIQKIRTEFNLVAQGADIADNEIKFDNNSNQNNSIAFVSPSTPS